MEENKELMETLKQGITLPNLDAVMGDPTIPKIYGNGFVAGISLADASIVIQLGSSPVAVITMSYTALKTLAITLDDTLSKIEDKFGPVKSIQELRETL